VGVSIDCPNFWVPPIISGTGKALKHSELPVGYVDPLNGPESSSHWIITLKKKKSYELQILYAYS